MSEILHHGATLTCAKCQWLGWRAAGGSSGYHKLMISEIDAPRSFDSTAMTSTSLRFSQPSSPPFESYVNVPALLFSTL